MATQKFISPSVHIDQTETRLKHGLDGQDDSPTIEARWLHFLSRWSALAGLLELSLVLIMMIGVMPVAQDSSLPDEFFEFVAASHNPVVYRLAMTFDAAVWVMIGGFLITLAAILVRRTPIRSALIAACGIGQAVGIAGALYRLDGTTALAARYLAATADQQAMLLQSYLDVQFAFTTLFNTGELLYAAGYLLIASIAWSMVEFPRWLTAGLALLGSLGLAQLGYHIVTGGDQFIIFFGQLILEIVIFFAVGWVFWRQGSALATRADSAN